MAATEFRDFAPTNTGKGSINQIKPGHTTAAGLTKLAQLCALSKINRTKWIWPVACPFIQAFLRRFPKVNQQVAAQDALQRGASCGLEYISEQFAWG